MTSLREGSAGQSQVHESAPQRASSASGSLGLAAAGRRQDRQAADPRLA